MNMTIKLTGILLIFLILSCENEETPGGETLENELLSLDVTYEKNTITNEIDFSMIAQINGEITDNTLSFTAGDGSDQSYLTPSDVAQQNSMTTLKYQSTHTYASTGTYTLLIWLEEYPSQKIEKTITLDPFLIIDRP